MAALKVEGRRFKLMELHHHSFGIRVRDYRPSVVPHDVSTNFSPKLIAGPRQGEFIASNMVEGGFDNCDHLPTKKDLLDDVSRRWFST